MTDAEIKLGRVLRAWENTPWSKGQCCCGRAVDCYFLVVGVFDELYGVNAPLPPRLPADTSVNNRRGAFAALRALMSRYPSQSFDAAAEPSRPGDVLIVRPPKAHPDTLQHAVIVGPQNRIWHAGRGGVAHTVIRQWSITHAFRTLEHERWLK